MISPVGNATRIAMKEVSNVPDSSGKMPKCLSAKSGVHWESVKKSIMLTSEKKA